MSFERGRQGATVLALPHRPLPPSYMLDKEKDVWRQTVESLPQDWFRAETLPLLEQYCVMVVRVRQTSQKIRHAKNSGKTLNQLIEQEMRQTKMMSHLATKMRLTQQSTFDRKKSKRTKNAMVKPWATGEEDDQEEE